MQPSPSPRLHDRRPAAGVAFAVSRVAAYLLVAALLLDQMLP